MISMTDVANKAGVSPATASVVLNNRQKKIGISDRTARRVLDAATELGYRRNELARAVGSGKNFVIGYLKVSTGQVELEVLDGVINAATEAGYLLKIIADAWPPDPVGMARICVEQRLAGLVSRTFMDQADTNLFSKELNSYGVPCVYVDDNVDLPDQMIVTCDDAQGCRLIIEHLTGLGHKQIAFIAGDSTRRQSILRKQIYKSAMAEHGLAVRESWIVDANWEIEQAEAATCQLFADRTDRPSALVCSGDEAAAVAMRTLGRLGYHVPGDVSVVGYGDMSYAKLLSPALTTIAQPFRETGRTAARLLLQQIKPAESQTEPLHPVLPVSLVVRESTAAATFMKGQ
jgi:DNA-binding LacI/PurR family transcriptional regulator